MLYGFKRPPKAAPIAGGVTAEEVEQRFCPAGWDLVSAERTSVETPVVPRASDRLNSGGITFDAPRTSRDTKATRALIIGTVVVAAFGGARSTVRIVATPA